MNLFEIVGIIHIIFYSFFGLYHIVHYFVKGLRSTVRLESSNVDAFIDKMYKK